MNVLTSTAGEAGSLAADPPDAAAPPQAADRASLRLAGGTLAGSSIVMLVGAAAFASAGVDFETASTNGTVPAILDDIVAGAAPLTVCFVLWTLGMVGYAVAARALTALPVNRVATNLASGLMSLGAALGGVVFLTYLTIVHSAAPAGAADLTATLTWLAVNLDWVATMLLAGLSVPIVVLAGHRELGLPGWMARFALAPLAGTVLTLVALATRTGLTTYGFLVVPFGMAFAITTAVQLWRRA